MARQLVHCVQLSDKLDSLYRESKKRPYLHPCVTSDAELARELGISKALVSVWRSGDPGKGREPNYVMPKQLERLAALTAVLLEIVVTLQDASGRLLDEPRALVEKSDREEFDARLRAIETKQLLSILRTTPRAIGVGIAKVPRALGANPERLRPMKEEVVLRWGDNFLLSVSGASDRQLVVLARDCDGWNWLVPGPTHRGTVTADPEMVPDHTALPWVYDEGSGPGIFFAIALPRRLKLPVRKRNAPSAMTVDQEQLLVKTLLDPDHAKNCGWGHCAFFIEPARA